MCNIISHAFLCAFVRACERACVCAYVRACVRPRAGLNLGLSLLLTDKHLTDTLGGSTNIAKVNLYCVPTSNTDRQTDLYKIILYWNVPCWGHQLWDINCCMCVCVCVCVCQCVSLSADISLYCAKNDSTDYPEIVWVCWV